MDPLLEEFRADLVRIEKLIELIELVRAFPSFTQPEQLPLHHFVRHSCQIYDISKTCHNNTVILNGTIVLYLAGRFESFVRTIFEDLCDRIVSKCQSYDYLPRRMRDNLIIMTAEVMQNPRKYGHGELGIKSFIKTLAINLDEGNPLTEINSKCLSITTENMKADSMDELFNRIGAKDIWGKIGQQARVQRFFESSDNIFVTKEAKSLLNEIMNIRNNIAHPSGSISWPDSDGVKKFINFFEVIANAISEIVNVYEVDLPLKTLQG
jgi:hypothetical protein